MTMPSFDRRNLKFAPLFDVDPVTGASIEVSYSDRTLETFGRVGAGWFCAGADSRPRAQQLAFPNELLGLSERRDFSGGNQRRRRQGGRPGARAIEERRCHASILLPPTLSVEAAGFRCLRKAILLNRLLARPERDDAALRKALYLQRNFLSRRTS